jgi:hypothetical protein
MPATRSVFHCAAEQLQIHPDNTSCLISAAAALLLLLLSGPEPEGLAVGELPGSSKKSPTRRILFLGTERLSVIFIYDITDPAKPVFQSIATSPRPDVNDFSTWLTGPEGVTFDFYSASSSKSMVAAADVDASTESRKMQVPIVLVAYEGSDHGGMALYRVSA